METPSTTAAQKMDKNGPYFSASLGLARDIERPSACPGWDQMLIYGDPCYDMLVPTC
jgi:hypothetical protein